MTGLAGRNDWVQSSLNILVLIIKHFAVVLPPDYTSIVAVCSFRVLQFSGPPLFCLEEFCSFEGRLTF
jgi:hypothetical protein